MVKISIFDENILEFAINLPVNNKIGYIRKFYNYKHPFLIDKKIVRMSANKYLPKNLIYKKKKGFPLYGLTNLKVNNHFYKNGFVSELLKINLKVEIDLVANNVDNYTVSKLAMLEIWGRLFASKGIY